MNRRFVKAWKKRKGELEAFIKSTPQKEYDEYIKLVKLIVEVIINQEFEEWEFKFDKDKIHEIDDGDYQGTLVFLIPEDAYQPHKYIITSVCYGSCSCCDTLQGIQGYEDGFPTEKQVDGYMELCLHLLQKMHTYDAWEGTFDGDE